MAGLGWVVPWRVGRATAPVRKTHSAPSSVDNFSDGMRLTWLRIKEPNFSHARLRTIGSWSATFKRGRIFAEKRWLP